MKPALLLLLAAAAWAQQRTLDCGVVKDTTMDPLSAQFYDVPDALHGDVLLVRVLYTGMDPAFKLNVSLTDRANRFVSPRVPVIQPGQPAPPTRSLRAPRSPWSSTSPSTGRTRSGSGIPPRRRDPTACPIPG